MRSLDFSRNALTSCVAAAMLAGCGGSQPPIGAPGAAPQASAIATRAKPTQNLFGLRVGSELAPPARQALLYFSSPAEEKVYVTSYPQGKLAGTLTGFASPAGLCSDDQGNIFVTDSINQNIVEYAHGGSSPIATLSDSGYLPVDCAFDARTGNLAVANSQSSSGPGNIAIYADEQGPATLYSDQNFSTYLSCAYDNKENLFLVAGTDGDFAFAELPKGSRHFRSLSVGFSGLDGVQLDGKYIAVGSSPGGEDASIYRVSVSKKIVTMKGTVPLDRGQHKVNLRYFWVGGAKVVGAFGNYIGFWKYPAGREVIKLLRYPSTWGVTVSR
jgi:hypothetical protein